MKDLHDASSEIPATRRTQLEVTDRRCAWCKGSISARARRDAVTCSKPCRQARHRFTRATGAAPVALDVARRIAYADPPYPGRAARYYAGHRDYAGEVDHAALLSRLATYDGWALSTSADALPSLLPLCPAGARVAVWVRGAVPNRRARGALNAYEPVIYVPARPLLHDDRRPLDTLVHHVTVMSTHPDRVIGTKPAAFSRWMFGLVAAAAGDTFDDLFPGSGLVAQAWRAYVASAGERDTNESGPR